MLFPLRDSKSLQRLPLAPDQALAALCETTVSVISLQNAVNGE